MNKLWINATLLSAFCVSSFAGTVSVKVNPIMQRNGPVSITLQNATTSTHYQVACYFSVFEKGFDAVISQSSGISQAPYYYLGPLSSQKFTFPSTIQPTSEERPYVLVINDMTGNGKLVIGDSPAQSNESSIAFQSCSASPINPL